ncbi:MAG: cytochrome bc complex cytochrome b subunit [Gloeomargaritaceae cyanobacterium C42_A2020_066]|nr:cytochrome bc complex cytochrome b subunit [Gloeomargaritaceae cyanobacterium C42_A2020_066]
MIGRIDGQRLWRRLATLGAVSILAMGFAAALTGVMLAFYYEPVAGGAHESLARVVQDIPNGWLVQSLHDWAGNGVIALGLIQIVVLFLGRRFQPGWLVAWISGILLVLATIGLGWTAMILDWDQVGYWRQKVELLTIEAIPVLGATLRDAITGGAGISSTTVAHQYALHSYVLSLGAMLLAVVHLASLLWQELQDAEVIKGWQPWGRPAALNSEESSLG